MLCSATRMPEASCCSEHTKSNNGYDENGEHKPGYAELIAELMERYPLGQPIIGEEAQKAFIRLFGSILRLRNILTAFDEFEGQEYFR